VRRRLSSINNCATLSWHNVCMSDRDIFSLRQTDQARTDFALIDDHLEFIAGQLVRLPTRPYLCRSLLLATASVWALLAVLLLL
jgi:hypothetical protein